MPLWGVVSFISFTPPVLQSPSEDDPVVLGGRDAGMVPRCLPHQVTVLNQHWEGFAWAHPEGARQIPSRQPRSLPTSDPSVLVPALLPDPFLLCWRELSLQGRAEP